MITDRIDNITKIPVDYQTPSPPPPKSVKIELTSRCNYLCGFCALRSREHQSNTDMDFGFFKSITKEMRGIGVEEIGVFYLGESFTAPKLLVDCIKYLKQDLHFPYVFITTNGSMAVPSVVEDCMRYGLDSLKWSCNSANEDQFEEIMGVDKKMFHKTLSNIKSAWEIRESGGYSTGLYASSIKYDDKQTKKMSSLLKKSILPYVDHHYWLPLYSMGSFATQREEELGYKPIAGNQGRLDALRQPLPCWAAFTEGHITVEGKLSACCFDATSNWIMGDLNKMSFMEAWHSDEFIKLREAHLSGDVSGTICKKCIAYS